MIPVIISKKVYARNSKLVGCNVYALQYDKNNYKCTKKEYYIQTSDFIKQIRSGAIHPINFTLKSNGVIVIIKYDNVRDAIQKIAKSMRIFLERQYGTGTNLCGHCIEASEYLEVLLRHYGISAVKQVEGYCLWEDECYGSDRPYDDHTWVEIGNQYYLDITADQFNNGFFDKNHFKPIEFRSRTPKEMMKTEPIDGEDYWLDC